MIKLLKNFKPMHNFLIRTFLIFLFTECLGSPASARLAETEAQLEARYGKPLGSLPGLIPGGFVRVYRTAKMQISVGFIGGISEREDYRPIVVMAENDPDTMRSYQFSEAEVRSILQMNQYAGKWDRLPVLSQVDNEQRGASLVEGKVLLAEASFSSVYVSVRSPKYECATPGNRS